MLVALSARSGTKVDGATIMPNTSIVLASSSGVVVKHATAYSTGCGWENEPYTVNPTTTNVMAYILCWGLTGQ